jgi:hypothetical protein
MQQHGIEQMPPYPEQRACRRPTTEQVLRLFTHTERHTLRSATHMVQVFEPKLSEMQCQARAAFRPQNLRREIHRERLQSRHPGTTALFIWRRHR